MKLMKQISIQHPKPGFRYLLRKRLHTLHSFMEWTVSQIRNKAPGVRTRATGWGLRTVLRIRAYSRRSLISGSSFFSFGNSFHRLTPKCKFALHQKANPDQPTHLLAIPNSLQQLSEFNHA